MTGREPIGKERTERQREGEAAALVDNGGAVVLRRLVKGQSRPSQTASSSQDLNAGKLPQVWPKQLGVTALAPNEATPCTSEASVRERLPATFLSVV